MIIKSHIRGGYRAAAEYLQSVGANERIRLVCITDIAAASLDEAFRNMWVVGRTTGAKKPLHHVSINPYKDERLTDVQVSVICGRLAEKYGYRPGDHQRVIVEHVREGRQHFHVMWNRVSLRTGRPVWPGHHWNKSRQTAREMEAELGLKAPVRRKKRSGVGRPRTRYPTAAGTGPLIAVRLLFRLAQRILLLSPAAALSKPVPAPRPFRTYRRASARRMYALPRRVWSPRGMSVEELIAWAWENRRSDILARFGIYVSFGL